MVDDSIRRTVKCRLTLPQDAIDQLERVFDEFRHGCQIAINHGWNHNISDKRALETAVKHRVETETQLKSQHCILACYQAADALASTRELQNKDDHDVSKPEFTSPFAAYDPRTLTVFPDQREVSLTVTNGSNRIRGQLVLPPEEDVHQWQYITGEEWQLTESTLHYRDGEYYLHLGYKKPAPETLDTAGNGTVLGVDLNVTGPFAVTSTGAFIGSADELNHHRREYETRRGRLQQCGTRSAHLTIASIGERFAEWSENWLHHRANTLVREAVQQDVDGIVFEALTDIRQRISDGAKFQQWAFARFIEFVTYKARERGVWVETVPAAYTSQECSRCGYVSRGNRDGKEFDCEWCERKVHADYDGAVMVAKKYVRLQQSRTCSGGGADCQPALKSGALPDDAASVRLMAVDLSTDKPSPSTSEPTAGERSRVG